MDYYELRFRLTVMDEAGDMLVAMLGDIGFESFIEEDDLLKAYISATDFNDECKVSLSGSEISRFYASYESELIKDRNWNAIWENEYDPVIIDNKLIIRAPFHTKPADIPLEIIIEPKMSFGTAHHETTRLMLRYMLELDLVNKSLLDMGCGTAALAILARKLGANPVMAIDNDEWAYNNSLENVGNNNIDDISVYHGDAGLLPGMSFDVILANINRNILLRDIPVYSGCLRSGGLLIMSGFYSADLQVITQCAHNSTLELLNERSENNWVAACFKKLK
jgi:ribosomal protein L11 methyltransferase